MRKNIVILAFLCLPMHNLFAHTVTIHRNNFSTIAGHMMHEHSQKARFWISLQEVQSYLPDQHQIKRGSIRLIEQRKVPGKTPLKILDHLTYHRKDVSHVKSTKKIFGKLLENKPHTYVILPDRLIFTESTSLPSTEFMKDKFTKHFLISGLVSSVSYSGEFFVYKNKINREIFVVFDNSSGTYKPSTELLPQVQKLLNANLNSSNPQDPEKIYIITKNFNQKIDKTKLFNHDPKPFI